MYARSAPARAQTYNQEGSGVYQDAEDLEMLFVRAVALAKRGVKPSKWPAHTRSGNRTRLRLRL